MEYKGPVITLWFLIDLLFGNFRGNFALSIAVLNSALILFLREWLLKGSLPFRNITVPSFFLWMYFGLMLLPSTIWFACYQTQASLDFFTVVQLVPILFILGIWGANFYFNSPPTIITRFFESDIFHAERINKIFFPLFLIAGGIEILIAAAYVLSADVVPLFQILVKDGVRGDSIRLAVYNSEAVLIFLYAFAVRILVPFTVLYPLYMMNRYGRRWAVTFWVSLLVGLFISLLTLERQSSLSLLCLLILSMFFLQGQRLRVRQFVGFLAGIAVLGGLVSLAQYGQTLGAMAVVERAVSYALMRLLLDPSYMTYLIFEDYADSDLLWGATIRFLSLAGVHYEHVTAIGFLADLWINYGWGGVILGPVALGFFLQYVQLRFFTVRSVPAMILYAVIILGAGWLIYSNMLPTMVVAVYAFGLLLMGLLAGQAAGQRASG
jgi:hypothetical protein